MASKCLAWFIVCAKPRKNSTFDTSWASSVFTVFAFTQTLHPTSSIWNYTVQGLTSSSRPAVKVPGMGGAMGNSCFPSGEKEGQYPRDLRHSSSQPPNALWFYKKPRLPIRDPIIKTSIVHHWVKNGDSHLGNKKIQLLLVFQGWLNSWERSVSASGSGRGDPKPTWLAEKNPWQKIATPWVFWQTFLDFSLLLIFMRFTLICCMHLYHTSPCLASLLWSTGSRARTLCH